MPALLLAMFDEQESVDVSAHIDLATQVELVGIGLLGLFFLLRPELWRRIWFDRVDPRPAAALRIVFGTVVLINFAVLLMRQGPLPYSAARFLFTDEGLWLTDMARKRYGGNLRALWDPEHGFEHWYDVFLAIGDRFTPLHLRSDPPFVFALYALMLASLGAMILGIRTRWSTLVSFVLVESFYRYSPVFYTGGDTVIRVFMFLAVFTRWGEAYSVDSWRRRRRAILSGQAARLPGYPTIPAWPLRMMMVQLCCIYCATGLLKSGGTWMTGSALFYALNLDHFYRFPMTQLATIGHMTGVLRLSAILVHWWEILFPLVLIGVALNGYERERTSGTWISASTWRRWASYAVFMAAWVMLSYIAGLGAYYYPPRRMIIGLTRPDLIPLVTIAVSLALPAAAGLYLTMRRYWPKGFEFVRLWMLGKRSWLLFGFLMHLGIALSMNVGTFAPVMPSVYFAWLAGSDLDEWWAYVYSRPARPGEEGRPTHAHPWKQKLLGPFDRLRFRCARAPYVVTHHPSAASVRRAALLRCWDLGHRLVFQADEDIPEQALIVQRSSGAPRLAGVHAAAALTEVLPGLLWLRPVARLGLGGPIARRILRQL